MPVMTNLTCCGVGRALLCLRVTKAFQFFAHLRAVVPL